MYGANTILSALMLFSSSICTTAVSEVFTTPYRATAIRAETTQDTKCLCPYLSCGEEFKKEWEVEQDMINVKQLRSSIKEILQVFSEGKYYSEDVVELLLMIAAHESKLGMYLEQVKGPALGLYQMEPETHDDLLQNYVFYRDNLASALLPFEQSNGLHSDQYKYDIRYATILARIHLYRDKEPLPSKDDITGMAKYAKRVWNTELGKATVEDYEQAYRDNVLGEW